MQSGSMKLSRRTTLGWLGPLLLALTSLFGCGTNRFEQEVKTEAAAVKLCAKQWLVGTGSFPPMNLKS